MHAHTPYFIILLCLTPDILLISVRVLPVNGLLEKTSHGKLGKHSQICYLPCYLIQYLYLLFQFYVFLLTALQEQSQHISVSQFCRPISPNPTCQLSLWEEIRIAGGNLQLLPECSFHEDCIKVTFRSPYQKLTNLRGKRQSYVLCH